MDLLDELRSFRPYLKARQKQIEQSSSRLSLRDELEVIEICLDVMDDILADQYGPDQLKGYIEKIHDMMRKNPVDEMKQDGTKSKYGHVRYQPVEFKDVDVIDLEVENEEVEDESINVGDNSRELDEWGLPQGENMYGYTRRGQNELWNDQPSDTIFGRDQSMQKKKEPEYATGFGRGRGFPNQRKMETSQPFNRGDTGRGKNVPLPDWLRDDGDQRPGPMNDNAFYVDGDVNWNNPDWKQNHQSEKWKDLEKYQQKLLENFERRPSTATRSGYQDQGTYGEGGPEQCPELSSTVASDSPTRPSKNGMSFSGNFHIAPNPPPLQGAFPSTSQSANYGYPVYPQPYPYSTPLPSPQAFLRPRPVNWNSMNQQNAGGGFTQRPPNLIPRQMNFGQPNRPHHGFVGSVPPGGTYGFPFPGNIPLPPQPLGADVFQNDSMYFLDTSPTNPALVDVGLINSAARKCFNRNRSSTMPPRKSFSKNRYFTSKSAANQDPRLNRQDRDKSSTSTSATSLDPRLNRQNREKSAPATPETSTTSSAEVHRIPRDPRNTIQNPCFSSKATQSQKRKLDETRERVKKSLSSEPVSRSSTLQDLRKRFQNDVLYRLGKPSPKKQDELQTQSKEKEDEPPPDGTGKDKAGSTMTNPSNKTGKAKKSKPPTKSNKSNQKTKRGRPKKSISQKPKSLPKAAKKKQPQPTSAKSSPLQTLMVRNGYKIPKKSQPKKVVPIYDSSSDSDHDDASSTSNTNSNSTLSKLTPSVSERFRKHLLETLGEDCRADEMDDEMLMDMYNSCATVIGEDFLKESDNTGENQLQSQRDQDPSDASEIGMSDTNSNVSKSTKRPTRSSSVDRLYKDLEDAGKGFGLPTAPIVRAKKRGRREMSPSSCSSSHDPQPSSSKQSRKKRRMTNQVMPKIALKKSGPVTRAQALAKKAKSAKKVSVLPHPSSWERIVRKANLRSERTSEKFVDRLGRPQIGAKDIFVNQNLNKIRLGSDYQSQVSIKTELAALKDEPEDDDAEPYFDIDNHVNISISEVEDESTSTPNTDLCIVNVVSLNQEEDNGNISANASNENGDQETNEPIFHEEENPTDRGAESSEPALPS